MYLTHLYEVEELYSPLQAFDARNSIIIFTDIVVIDLRAYISDSKKADMWTNRFLLNNYVITEEYDGIIRVLERTETSPPTGHIEDINEPENEENE